MTDLLVSVKMNLKFFKKIILPVPNIFYTQKYKIQVLKFLIFVVLPALLRHIKSIISLHLLLNIYYYFYTKINKFNHITISFIF